MKSKRRLRVLSPDELLHLNEARLLEYRKKALSLWNSPEDGDFTADEARSLDPNYIWFKSDPRWQPAYDQILDALAQVQSSHSSS